MRAPLGSRVLRILVLILIVYQVRDNVGLSDVYQKRVSDDYRALELRKSTVAFTKIFDFILSVKRVTLNVKLATLVIIASAHHGVHCWHVLASI